MNAQRRCSRCLNFQQRHGGRRAGWVQLGGRERGTTKGDASVARASSAEVAGLAAGAESWPSPAGCGLGRSSPARHVPTVRSRPRARRDARRRHRLARDEAFLAARRPQDAETTRPAACLSLQRLFLGVFRQAAAEHACTHVCLLLLTLDTTRRRMEAGRCLPLPIRGGLAARRAVDCMGRLSSLWPLVSLIRCDRSAWMIPAAPKRP